MTTNNPASDLPLMKQKNWQKGDQCLIRDDKGGNHEATVEQIVGDGKVKFSFQENPENWREGDHCEVSDDNGVYHEATIETIAKQGSVILNFDKKHESSKNKSKLIKIASFLALLALVVIIIIVVLALTLSGSSLTDCSHDNFTEVRFGNNSYLKVSFHVDTLRGFEFQQGQDKCRELQSELWEVQSKLEWNAVMDALRPLGVKDRSFWLNGKVKERCTGGLTICKKDEADEGNGLKVIWASNGKESTYSRFIGGSADCIIVNKDERRLWETKPCDDAYMNLCVKRNCQDPLK